MRDVQPKEKELETRKRKRKSRNRWARKKALMESMRNICTSQVSEQEGGGGAQVDACPVPKIGVHIVLGAEATTWTRGRAVEEGQGVQFGSLHLGR